MSSRFAFRASRVSFWYPFGPFAPPQNEVHFLDGPPNPPWIAKWRSEGVKFTPEDNLCEKVQVCEKRYVFHCFFMILGYRNYGFQCAILFLHLFDESHDFFTWSFMCDASSLLFHLTSSSRRFSVPPQGNLFQPKSIPRRPLCGLSGGCKRLKS